MTSLCDLPDAELRERLHLGTLRLQCGPFIYNIKTREEKILRNLRVLYSGFTVHREPGFSDFHIGLLPAGLSQRFRGVVEFYWDGRCPLNIIEVKHSYAFLEWGMNWCVSTAPNEYLKLHAAVLEKNGKALIMPGLPGAGKSTLCAALTLTGWRLLSDEHALIPLQTAGVVPLCRPVSLKNESINIIRDRFDTAILGEVAEETHKGRVAHLKADLAENSHDIQPVPATLMVFPHYAADSKLSLRPKSRSEAFMFAGLHSFNYRHLRETGFDTMSLLMQNVSCFDLNYGTLDQALSAIDELESEMCR